MCSNTHLILLTMKAFWNQINTNLCPRKLILIFKSIYAKNKFLKPVSWEKEERVEKATRRKVDTIFKITKKTCIIRIVAESSLLKISTSLNMKGSIMYSWIQEEEAGDFSTGAYLHNYFWHMKSASVWEHFLMCLTCTH